MAAYGALVSVMQIMDQTHRHPHPPISLHEKQVESLAANLTFLQEFLEAYNPHVTYNSEADPLESRIAEAAYAAEDVIETYIFDQIHARSTDNVEEISPIEFYQVDAQSFQAALKKNKRKRQAPSASAAEKMTSATSSERTADLGSSQLDAPVRSSPLLQLEGQQFRRALLSLDDEVTIVETGPTSGPGHAREMSFPEEAEVALGGLEGLASFIRSGVAKYRRINAEVAAVEDRLMAKISVAEAAAQAAAEREAAALAAAEEMKRKNADLQAEVDRLKSEAAGVVAGQGDAFRAVVERVLRSKHFSRMAVQLASALSTPIVSAVLDEIAVDIPDLDKAKYGYGVMTEEETLQDFAGVLLESGSSFPVVEQLAAQRAVLSGEAIRRCPVDRYDLLETVIADQLKSPATQATEEPARVDPEEPEVGLEDENRDGVD